MYVAPRPVFPGPFSGRRSSVFAYLGYFLSLCRGHCTAILPSIRTINPNIAFESNCCHDWQIALSVPRRILFSPPSSLGAGRTPSSGFLRRRMLRRDTVRRRLGSSTGLKEKRWMRQGLVCVLVASSFCLFLLYSFFLFSSFLIAKVLRYRIHDGRGKYLSRKFDKFFCWIPRPLLLTVASLWKYSSFHVSKVSHYEIHDGCGRYIFQESSTNWQGQASLWKYVEN